MPVVVVQRRHAVADETPVERLQQDEHRRPLRPARGAGGAHEHCQRLRGARVQGEDWLGIRAEIEVHGHHLVNRAVQERPDRPENRCCRRRVRLATELGRPTSGSTRLSRTSRSLPLEGSTGLQSAVLALNAQRRRSRRAPHNVAADAADRAPSAASAIGVAAPGAWPLRWTRAAVLAAAKAAKSCKASFMAFYKGLRTHVPP